MKRLAIALLAALLATILAALPAATPAQAAGGLDGAAMGLAWALPFIGILLSIATGPLLFAKFWHDHYGKIGAAWAALTLGTIALAFGVSASLAAFVHALFAEYMSFIILLFSLYVVAGGILIEGDIRGVPQTNAVILAIGAVMASIVGTTGAAMILVRPLIRANRARSHNTHVVVFFIFLVANIGGALSPLGDPPLFVGFLRGVDFFWTTKYLWAETALVSAIVLVVFVALDAWLASKEPERPATGGGAAIRFRGIINIPLIAAIIAAIMLSAVWKPGIALTIYGTKVELQNLVRDGVLVLIAIASLWLTPEEHREANDFTWEPIREVAKLFAAIFTCIIPVLAILDAGRDGVLGWLLNAVTAKDGSPHEVA
jgi:Na+/H+ antiporter NhaD/arsenite permease-like protein